MGLVATSSIPKRSPSPGYAFLNKFYELIDRVKLFNPECRRRCSSSGFLLWHFSPARGKKLYFTLKVRAGYNTKKG